MDKKQKPDSKTDLTAQALENLSEEQLNDLMIKLTALKQQKADERKDADASAVSGDIPPFSAGGDEPPAPSGTAGIPDREDDISPLIFPDPSCFSELDDEDATKIFSAVNPKTEEPDGSVPIGRTETAEACPSPAEDTDSPVTILNSGTDEPGEEAMDIYRDLIRRRKRQRRLTIILLAVFGMILILIMLLVGYLTLYRPNMHDDPQNLPFDPIVTGSAGTADSSGTDAVTTPVIGDVSAPEISDRYERKEDFYTFLILGVDRAANLSDVIMLVSFDVRNEKISVVSLPRDSYVDTGKNFHKINAYFSSCYNHSPKTGEERYRDAITGMASFLEKGLCVKIDRYVCMDTAGFREIVDAIGGVHMEVPFDMDYEDPEQDLYIHLKAGYQLLDGASAEQFVRFRKAYLNGDLGRISAQKLFLTALAKEIKDKLDVSTAVSLAKTTLPYVTTNLTAAEIGYFAMHALQVDLEKIAFTTFPGAGAVNPQSGASYYVLYAEAVRTIVNNHLNVYTREISRDVFLSNSVKFTSDETYIAEVFLSDYILDDTISAGDVADSGVDIPRR